MSAIRVTPPSVCNSRAPSPATCSTYSGSSRTPSPALSTCSQGAETSWRGPHYPRSAYGQRSLPSVPLVPGDVLYVKGSGYLGQLGAAGGFMGHVMLAVAPPRQILPGSSEAQELSAVWPRGDAPVVWMVRTVESTRGQAGLYESDVLLYAEPIAGKLFLIGEISASGQELSPVDMEAVELLQSPKELRSMIRGEVVSEVLREMQLHARSWSFATAAKAFFRNANHSFHSNLSNRTALLREIQECWESRPICTSVVIVFWQRYLCKLTATTQQATDLILRWMPPKADRALPGELLSAMRECGWARTCKVTLSAPSPVALSPPTQPLVHHPAAANLLQVPARSDSHHSRPPVPAHSFLGAAPRVSSARRERPAAPSGCDPMQACCSAADKGPSTIQSPPASHRVALPVGAATCVQGSGNLLSPPERNESGLQCPRRTASVQRSGHRQEELATTMPTSGGDVRVQARSAMQRAPTPSPHSSTRECCSAGDPRAGAMPLNRSSTPITRQSSSPATSCRVDWTSEPAEFYQQSESQQRPRRGQFTPDFREARAAKESGNELRVSANKLLAAAKEIEAMDIEAMLHPVLVWPPRDEQRKNDTTWNPEWSL
eukprot:gnl/TRDRNA2_/TRDRNA2_176335_c0_seq4.p1 gnl/TRDRNA2_/TRDRNA2_176335_c0~~gnl/TRDRNA2_/TRDRNA2_176335_c0_seq4.p1  ORF type:complete len:605 (+),score=66.82 gnl/TRDRNA2_/TRDRNA2_176335_c0_seq4:79-1893(+)